MSERKLTYRPEIFDVKDVASAMNIILTPEVGTTTEERWQYETPFLVDEMGRETGLDDRAFVLDYGCGIGRIAKGLIERYGCRVIGVDISAGMRELAPRYVASDRFAVCSPEMFDGMVARGLRATHACACWVIQHCVAPQVDLKRIDSALSAGGQLYIVSSTYRCVPSDAGWVDDGVSMEDLFTARFDQRMKRVLPDVISTPQLAETSYTMVLEKRSPSV